MNEHLIKHPRPTRDRVVELLEYEPSSGLFRWKEDRIAKGRVVAAKGHVAGTFHPKYGRSISLDGKQFRAHLMAWLVVHGVWPRLIDHKDGDKDNNRIDNLRSTTIRVNAQNQRKATSANRSSGLLGVSRSRSRLKPWKAQIQAEGRIQHIGCFATAQDAHDAYVQTKRRLHEGCTL